MKLGRQLGHFNKIYLRIENLDEDLNDWITQLWDDRKVHIQDCDEITPKEWEQKFLDYEDKLTEAKKPSEIKDLLEDLIHELVPVLGTVEVVIDNYDNILEEEPEILK